MESNADDAAKVQVLIPYHQAVPNEYFQTPGSAALTDLIT